jgi:hypothetical protein
MKEFLGLVLLCLFLSTAQAKLGPKLSIEKQILDSSTVVHGRVVSLSSRRLTLANGDEVILSRMLVDVQETLKGESDEQVIVEVIGGTINKGRADELTMRSSDSPAPMINEEVVLFLEQDKTFLDAKALKFGADSYMKIDKSTRKAGGKSLDEIKSLSKRGAK